MKQYTLNDLKTFTAVIESGSFNKAADRLDTSAASVSPRVASLENALGIRLLSRTTRTLHPTDAGQRFFDDICSVLGALQESEDRLRDEKTSLTGSLRVAAPMSFGIESIAPLISQFLKLHPQLHIDLQLEDKQTDLYAEGIDLAIRIGKLEDSSLVATKLCEIDFGYFASPEYLEKWSEPKTPQDLSNHNCLTYSLTNHARGWGLEKHSINLKGTFSANNGEALCEAAVQGLGIVALPRFIVKSALTERKLVSIMEDFVTVPAGLYAIRVSRQFTPAKVRLLIEFLKSKLGSE